jgi:hypothetical protein
VKKATFIILNQLNIKKNRQIILEKIITKKIKTMLGNTVAIHIVLKKKITKLNF